MIALNSEIKVLLILKCPLHYSFTFPAGVVVLSWYPPGVADDHGEPTEDLVPAVMDAAHRHSIKVTGEKTGMFFFPFWLFVRRVTASYEKKRNTQMHLPPVGTHPELFFPSQGLCLAAAMHCGSLASK